MHQGAIFISSMYACIHMHACIGSAQGCQVQNSIVAAVSGLLGLLLIAACVASAALMGRIRGTLRNTARYICNSIYACSDRGADDLDITHPMHACV